MKKIAVLGSTGSIGRQAVDVLAMNKLGLIADSLIAHSDTERLIAQAEELRPSKVGILDEKAATKEVLSRLNGLGCAVAVGAEAFDICLEADEILFCIVGADGLRALFRYIESGKTIALANKECLVTAGELLMKKAKEDQIIPVDSEHSAVWQCLRMGNRGDLKQIILTASGGRYYDYPYEKLDSITPDEAVRHPNWKMGKKISVDSATMMNKALEILEARWLFGTKNIDYVIHPESIIHSLVRFCDGTIAAQLSLPDMKLPISAALAYPDRVEGCVKDFAFDRKLTFLPRREDVFFAPKLAYYCMEVGGSAGAVLDAADEGAVRLFLNGKIPFSEIATTVKRELYSRKIISNPSLDDLIAEHDEVKNRILYSVSGKEKA